MAPSRLTVFVALCARCNTVVATEGDPTFQRLSISCKGCSSFVTLKKVHGAVDKSIPCNDQCQFAHSDTCDCSCGGDNHARGYLRAEVPARIVERDEARALAKQHRAEERVASTRRVLAEVRDGYLEQWPALQHLTEFADHSDFLADMQRAFQRGTMTPRQLAATATAVTDLQRRERERVQRDLDDEALRAAGVTVPIGKTEFVAVVISAQDRGADRYGKPQRKMLLRSTAGWRVWGTIPATLLRDYTFSELRGKRLRLTAVTEPKEDGDDPLFGFFKQPKVLEVMVDET